MFNKNGMHDNYYNIDNIHGIIVKVLNTMFGHYLILSSLLFIIKYRVTCFFFQIRGRYL